MPFLTVGGTTVEVADDTVDGEEFEVGEVRPAFSGKPRSSVRAYRSRWSMRTIPLARATADTLKGLLKAAPPLTVTGDLTGAIDAYALNIRTHSSTGSGGAELVVVTFDLWAAS